ncbi:MAG TPA: class I SAM-dependent methyltransferase [Dehalococcoidia bacterium]|nr:class I SAM-dependent methyltransferase [Dehalococcoidia bacterium]
MAAADEATQKLQPADPREVRAFAGKLFDFYNGAMVTFMVDIGRRTGLFEAAARGPASSAELAGRAGLQERYVREWLAALTAGGVFTYEPAGGIYILPPAHAACLTGDPRTNLTAPSRLPVLLGKFVPALAECFVNGGGVPYSAFRPEFTESQTITSRTRHDAWLLDGYLAVGGLRERLAAGARVADVGCGTGHAVNLMGRAFPVSSFTGFDIAADALALGEAEAREFGLPNVRFVRRDVAELPAQPPFDLITSFDAIHDQARPAAVLRGIRSALAPGGAYLMVEPRAGSNLEENLRNPGAPFAYGVSVLHCLTVSLAEGGAGLGTLWGEQIARRMLGEAGFTSVEVTPAPDRLNNLFLCRPE